MKESSQRAYAHERLGNLSLAEVVARRKKSVKSRERAHVPPLVPQQRGAVVPLSYAQERLWFLDQLEMVGTAYNLPMALRLRGELNVAVMEQSILALLRRHESLRARFESVGGTPRQIVEPIESFTLPIVDLSTLPETQRMPEVLRLVREDAERAFDLTSSPMLRASLLELAADDHVFLMTVHHIAADGWSLSVAMREISALYAAKLRDDPDPLPAMPLQYPDFAIWQRQWLQGQVLEEQLRYWKEQLRAAPPQLELSTDRPRPAVESFKGARFKFELPPSLRASMENLAQQEGATLFMVCLAAYQTLLSRWSGQDDIVVGTPIAGRTSSDVEGLVGLFVNTLALRTDLSGRPTFRQLLGRVKQVTLDAYSHQAVPFETIVRELQPDRDLSRQPVLQTMMALQNYPEERLDLPGLTWTWLDIDRTTAHFDLVLHLYEQAGVMRGMFAYASDLFDERTIARMAEAFRVLLDAVTRNPDISLHRAPLLSDTERRKILMEWNATLRPFPHDRCVHELFEDQARRTPDAIAIVAGEQELTYTALNASANQLAHYLVALGTEPGECVPILMSRSVELLIAEIAVLKCGAVYVPLDPRLPEERHLFMIHDCGARRALSADPVGATLANHPLEWIDWSELAADLETLPTGNLQRRGHALSAAYAMYTSGSTGKPKGVLVPHRAVNRLVINNGYSDIGPADCVAHCSNPAFDASTFEIWSALLTGARVLIVPQDVLLDEARLATLLCEQDATALILTTGLFNQSSEVMRPAFTRLRFLLTGGDVMDAGAVARVMASMRPKCLLNAYGPTECTTLATTHVVQANDAANARIPIGRPISNTQIYILDDSLQPVPVGVGGEIYIGGPGLAIGYLNRPELTAQRFICDPFSDTPDARMYKTGDLGRWRSDGSIEFLGRNDHQVKIRGFRIELGEIETCLSRHPDVRDVAVIAMELSGDKRLVAYVTASAERDPDIEDLRDHLKASLPGYMVPSAFMVLEELPLTPIGKLDRRALPVPDVLGHSSEHYVAPEGQVEQQLARIWQQLLGLDRVGRDDNFFEIGGHSLQGIKLVAKVSEQFGIQLSGAAVFQHPTIRQMASAVQRLAPLGESNMVESRLAARQIECAPLAFSQRAHWRAYRLSERPAIRQIASASRLRGRLMIPVLQQCINEVIRRHDALRTQIVKGEDGELMQLTAPAADLELSVVDLAELPEQEREPRLMQLIEQLIMQPIDVSVDRLLDLRLVRLSDDEHALIIAMEHMIADQASMNILLRELWISYEQVVGGQPSCLPPVLGQFTELAIAQSRAHTSWLQEHDAYWNSIAQRFGRLRFGPDARLREPRPGWQSIRLVIERNLKSELEAWCRLRRTTLVMSVFTAYAALVLRWCDVREGVIRYQADGRNGANFENAIGYFAAALYVAVDLRDSDSFVSLLERVTAAYVVAFEHADASYLTAQPVLPGFVKNAGFNWVPQDASPAASAASSIERSAIRFPHPMLKSSETDTEPSTLFFDLGAEIQAEILFPSTRFSAETMERFAQSLSALLRALVRSPDTLVTGIELSK